MISEMRMQLFMQGGRTVVPLIPILPQCNMTLYIVYWAILNLYVEIPEFLSPVFANRAPDAHVAMHGR